MFLPLPMQLPSGMQTTVISTSASISGTPGRTDISVSVTDAACGEANGSLTLGGVTGGTAPFTYSVDGSLYSVTTTYSDLPAGSHSINVKDNNGCIYSTTASISNSNGPTNIDISTTNSTCGEANGSLILGIVTGGTAPYTYSVDGSLYSVTTTYSDLPAGSHSINVKDNNGCIYSTTASISNSNGPTNIDISTTNSTCGEANGSLTLGIVTGGTAPYTYSVDGSLYSVTTTYSDLPAGSHSINVKDNNGCIYSTTASISNTSGPTDISVSVTDATCGQDNGSMTLGTVTGGTSPYTYSVDGGAFTSTTVYSNLSAASHAIIVRDANNCEFSTSASISNTSGPTDISVSVTDAACGEANGSLTLGGVTGGTAPFAYSVDGSLYSVTTTYSDLPAGSHSINVKDNNGCIYSTTASISNTSGPTDISVSVTDAACGETNGSLTLGGVTGGTAPFTYSVDGSLYSVTTTYSNLPAGSHSINVKDNNGCIYSTTASISNSNGPTNIDISTTNSTCGEANGSLTLGIVTGGTAPYTYSVDGSLYSVTTTYSNLPAGSHSINVKDNNGCEFITFISISEIPVPSATINGNVSICSGSSATISVTLTGTSPWSLTYSDGITPVTINNVLSSPYEFIVSPETTTTYLITEVSDGNCSSGNTHGSAVITIASQIIPTFDPIGPLCQGSTSPDLPLNSTNTPPITGTWSPAVISTTADGTYTFTPDPGQCATQTSITITIDDKITPTFTQIGPLCQGSTPPDLPLSSTNTPPITGTWSPAVISTTADDTYTFTPDPGQCATQASITITINDKITPTFNPVPSICAGEPLSPLPVTSTEGITGSWSPAINNTKTTTYLFTPDGGQCAATTEITITVNPVPTVPGVNVDCSLGFDHAILTVTSPIGDYQYSLDGTTFQDGTSFTGVANGTHSIVARNKTTSCVSSATTLNVNCDCSNPPSVTLNGISGSTCVSTPITISGNSFDGSATEVAVSHNGNGTLNAGTFTVSPFDLTYSPVAADAGKTITITVTTDNPSGPPCSATSANYSLTVNPEITPTFDPIGPICQGSTPPALPNISANGVVGTWTPASINTSTVGTTPYLFTPTESPCALPITLDISINETVTPKFTPIDPICKSSEPPVLPTVSDNNIAGTWNPPYIDTSTPGTKTYTFTPSESACATTTTLPIVILPTSHSTTIVEICSNNLPYGWNGNSYDHDGIFEVKLIGKNGCDSIATLDLKVVDEANTNLRSNYTNMSIFCSSSHYHRHQQMV